MGRGVGLSTWGLHLACSVFSKMKPTNRRRLRLRFVERFAFRRSEVPSLHGYEYTRERVDKHPTYDARMIRDHDVRCKDCEKQEGAADSARAGATKYMVWRRCGVSMQASKRSILCLC